ncbi:HAD-IA family hydrolase [Devosia sp.]|uniref:HAD-IA family hydrolase n=1 Tax=Devosia sp. TaxID=1871048 RepID=UPI001AD10EDD|nr:HAD-IA family hydrolase [Devosia sp.]MBN9336181.1 HAD-IA family hydrolase [Devosia sp.]
MSRQNIGLVIFDCDGVLIDSEPIASRTLATALQDAGIAISAEEALRVFTGNSEPAIRKMCADDYGLADVDGTFSKWHEALEHAFATDLLPMRGMVDLVAQLDLPKCVASNSRTRRLQQSLGNTALWEIFSPHIYSAEMVDRPKPAPDLLLHCADQLGVDPDACVMIDDSAHGIAAAHAAGMRSIGFVDPNDPRPGRPKALEHAGADHVVTGAAALAAVLAQMA